MMRTPQRRVTRTQVSRTLSVSAPVGGWNARDPLAEMKKTDAVALENFFCTPFDVMLRYGYSNYSTGITGTVNTLCSYSPPVGSIKLFAAAGASIYDASASGASGGAVVTGNLSDKWQHAIFGTSAGTFLVMANGFDPVLVYNGTGWGGVFSAAFNTSVTSITSAGTLATVTMANPHNLKTGMQIVVSGFTPAGYNGTYTITVTSTSTFTYVLAAPLGVTTVTGIATPGVNFAITGVASTSLISVSAFKSRLFFIEKSSMRAWYLPTLSIGGAAAQLDFGSLFTRGGYLMAMGTWSLDAGYGMDDYAVFVSSEGQVAVYKGTDPASAATWALIGIYDVGSPIGRRCMMKYAGDLTIICQDGLAPMSKALMSSRVNSQSMLTDKIQHVIGDYIGTYSANFGWETALFPKANMLLMNIPISPTASRQVVMNTISGAWSLFTGWDAACWELHGDNLYFGTAGAVCKAWDTYADAGTNINFNAQQSFSYFGSGSQLKKVNMVRPVISTDGYPTILFGVNVDFDTSDPQGLPTFSPFSMTPAVWDASLWDDGSTWAGDLATKRDWQTAFGIGYSIAGHMKGYAKNTRLRWASTDFLVDDGGVL
jgi:hypothetical protein